MKKGLSVVSASILFAACSGSTSTPGAPTIGTQPSNASAVVGQTATFSVVANGTGPLSYQWQRNGAPVSGETQASTTTPATTLADNGAKYRVVVTNASGSITSDEATLTVTMGTGAQTLTLNTVGLAGDGGPAFVAFQDGDSAWQGATPGAGGVYTFTVTADRYGIAVADIPSGSVPPAPVGFIYQGTVSETPVINLPLSRPQQAPVTLVPVTATIVGLVDGGGATIYGCGSATEASPQVMCMLPPGSFDALARTPEFYELRRKLTIFSAPTYLGGFDFGSGPTRLDKHTATVTGLPPNNSNAANGGSGVQLHLSNRDELVGLSANPLLPNFPSDANGVASVPIVLLPSSDVQPDDVQYLILRTGTRAVPPANVSSKVEEVRYFNATGDLTISSPDDFDSQPASFASLTPYPRAQITWTPTSSLPLYRVNVLSNAVWYCHITQGWLQGAGPVTYAFPDLSAVPGWSSAYQAVAGNDVLVSIDGISSVDLGLVYSPSQYEQPPVFIPFVPTDGMNVIRVMHAVYDLGGD